MATVVRRGRRDTGHDPAYVPPANQPGSRAPAFKPWHPDLTPPLGFYDPVLDANLGAANRGLFDTKQDVETQQGRLTSDYATGVSSINRGADRQLADIGTQRTQGQEDYQRNVADLHTAYDRLQSTQQQRMNASGLLYGGAALQAAEKRAANQQHDQGQLDTGFQRLTSGLDTATGRVNEDRGLALGDLALKEAPPDAGNPFGGRAFQDLATQLTRAKREGAAFGLDTSAAKAAQAAANGWQPQTTKTVHRNGMIYTIDPHGRVISKRKA